jgi:hypothetical protein
MIHFNQINKTTLLLTFHLVIEKLDHTNGQMKGLFVPF